MRCVVCGCTHLVYAFPSEGRKVRHCTDCGLLQVWPRPRAAARRGVEFAADPVRYLLGLRKGRLELKTPSLHSRPWAEFKAPALQFFNRATLGNLLAKCGFEQVSLREEGGMLHATAVPGTLRRRPLLSIIVPVFNEKATFKAMMQALLAKKMEGVDREILLVESNSTDGTRDEVLKFRGRAGIRVILEERPRGKGHAVRTGLGEAKGDIVTIQDADLEYDVNDYDQLLEPLVNYRQAFVLGSRHSNTWKMREYTDKPLLTALANGAHLFFCGLLNLACGSKLKDPFTMYKVFRRDCIWDLHLQGNRFDFDWEIVIKLIRAGFQPVEISVNYFSRGWEEGKKIRIFADPPTWVWACFKNRFGRLRK